MRPRSAYEPAATTGCSASATAVATSLSAVFWLKSTGGTDYATSLKDLRRSVAVGVRSGRTNLRSLRTKTVTWHNATSAKPNVTKGGAGSTCEN